MSDVVRGGLEIDKAWLPNKSFRLYMFFFLFELPINRPPNNPDISSVDSSLSVDSVQRPQGQTTAFQTRDAKLSSDQSNHHLGKLARNVSTNMQGLRTSECH